MKAAPTPHPAIQAILTKIEEHHALEKDFANDQTLNLAQAALDQAKAAVAEAELEDDEIDPEELVDRRLEARRQVEIAEIRLGRAQKALESRGQSVMQPIREAGRIAAAALREIAEPFGVALEKSLRKIVGDDDFAADGGHYKSLIYRKKERLFAHARACESNASVGCMERAIAMLEDATRLG
jgi:hypothetical protein